MRQIALFTALCLALLSCKKQTEEVVVITPHASTTQITIDQVINDSTLLLKWTKYTGDHFQKYQLRRMALYVKGGLFGAYVESIDSSTDINHLSFTEKAMPLARDIYYDIYVSTDTTQYGRGYRQVARVQYQRPNSLLFATPTDVLIDRQQQKLYVTEQYGVTVIDYNSRILASAYFPVSIGYCALGDFNGSKELYVPVNDGWLQILDAATLQVKDKIYVAGFTIGSVVAANGKLYVGSSDMSTSGYSNCIKVFDRATKELVGRTGFWDRTRLVQLEGSSVEMIDLTINLIPIDLSYYQFSAAGVPMVKRQDTYHGDYLMDAGIVRSFPDGSKFITSSSGTIFNKSLVFDRYIKQYGSYSDFAFNTDGSLIYAANSAQQKIDIITYPGTTNTGSLNTVYNPYKIFRDGNTLICVSKALQTACLLVEKINL